MPSVPGTISGNINNFDGQWIVEGNPISLHGDLAQFPEKWDANATLEYDDVEDLAGDLYIIDEQSPSYIGPPDLRLSLAGEGGKTITIVGFLTSPISERIEVNGRASLLR